VAVAYVNFGESYDPINLNSSAQAQTASSYTIQQGDSLQSIAQALWGDAGLWYLIADANGLSSGQTLGLLGLR
jgi:nucleoid-associated protein YgaU